MPSVGDLVANLIADTTQWKSGMSQAKNDLSSFAGFVGKSLAGIAAGFATLDFAKSALHGAEEDMSSARKLGAVLQSNGNVAGVTASEISNLAGKLQLLTKYEDNATMAAAAIIASFSNIRGDNFEKAIRLSQDMATVLDIDLSKAAKKIGKELEDIDPEKVGHRLDVMASRFSGAAEAAVTATEKMKNAIGELKDSLGGQLVPFAELISNTAVPALVTMTDEISNLDDKSVNAQDHATNYVRSLFLPFDVISNWKMLRDIVRDINENMPGKEIKENIAIPLDEWPAPPIEKIFAEGEQPLFDDMEEQFFHKMRGLQHEIDALFGDATHSEIEYQKAIEAGFSPEQAQKIKEQIELLDGLKQIEKDREEEERKSKKSIDVKSNREQSTRIAAMQRGSAEAVSAILKASREGIDEKQLNAEETQVEQGEEMLALLRDIRDGGSEISLMAGSLA